MIGSFQGRGAVRRRDMHAVAWTYRSLVHFDIVGNMRVGGWFGEVVHGQRREGLGKCKFVLLVGEKGNLVSHCLDHERLQVV